MPIVSAAAAARIADRRILAVPLGRERAAVVAAVSEE
jgi:hypothetical protein